MKRYTASVSFESDTQPVETVRVTVAAAGLSGAFRRAVVEAQAQKPTLNRYRSVVCVLEEVSDS